MSELLCKPHVVMAKYKGKTVYRRFIEPRIGDTAYHEEHFAMQCEALDILDYLQKREDL